MKEIIVDTNEPIRIDSYLAKKETELSRSNIQKMIQNRSNNCKWKKCKIII